MLNENYLRSLIGKAPQEVASILLRDEGGVQRNAEVAAWGVVYSMPPKSEGHQFWVQVISNIVFGGEYPAVERREFIATPNMLVPSGMVEQGAPFDEQVENLDNFLQ